MRVGCLSLVFAVALAIILPWVFADLLATALIKLDLRPGTAGLIVLGIFAGSLINIPVHRVRRHAAVPVDPLAVFWLHGVWPAVQRQQTETVVAVNVGGCLIPVALALYEVIELWRRPGAMAVLVLAVAVNVVICYRLARPVPGVGIVLPAIVPAAVACTIALLMAPAAATPVAFVAGVAGPLIGADLLHLVSVRDMESGMVSIGGAGTFDGILLTGILALYLA